MSKKNYNGYINDHSGSMSQIGGAAMKDFNSNIANTKDNAGQYDIDTIVSVVECGIYDGRLGTINRFARTLSGLASVKALEKYATDGGNTPLYDAVGMVIDQFKAVPDASDPEVSFLVFVTTDGGDNSSRKWNARTLGDEIRKLQATDRWTFVFRVPFGQRNYIINNLGIPAGNVQEWEQSVRGVEATTIATKSAVTDYYAARSVGQTSVKSFYSDMSAVKPKDVKTKLDDISSQVTIWPVFPKDASAEIKPFVEDRLSTEYVKGAAFYELVKTERRVQATKMVVVQDKKTKMIYGGAAARQLLGLPDNQDVRMVPGNHGAFTVYIQSTSINRKLPEGSSVLYWPKFEG